MCDVGQMLFWGKSWVWYLTAIMFLLNNTFIQVTMATKFLAKGQRLIATGSPCPDRSQVSEHDDQP